MSFSYTELMCPMAVKVEGVGHIKSPTLREIYALTLPVYQGYLNVLSMDVDDYFKIYPNENIDNLTIDRMVGINIFDLLMKHTEYQNFILDALNFFFEETVFYLPVDRAYVLYENDANSPEGIINNQNFVQIANLILQRNYVKIDRVDLSHVKNTKGLKTYLKCKQGRAQMQANKQQSDDMELGNIISAVANNHFSINPLNVYDLTIFLLWDSFSKLQVNKLYDIQKTSVAVWGDQKKQFDINSWYKKIQNK